MISECDNCGKIKEVKSYIWRFKDLKNVINLTKDKEGYIDCCKNCYESLKLAGYELEEE